MIDRGHELPLSRQAAVLGISRGSLYYSACPVPAAALAIMRRIDELHLDYPFAGSRMLRDLLRGEGIAIGRDQVTTMMRRMAIEAVYRRPHTSKPADGHKAFPYLLRGMAIERVNQVWRWISLIYLWGTRRFPICCAGWRSSVSTRCGDGPGRSRCPRRDFRPTMTGHRLVDRVERSRHPW